MMKTIGMMEKSDFFIRKSGGLSLSHRLYFLLSFALCLFFQYKKCEEESPLMPPSEPKSLFHGRRRDVFPTYGNK